MLTILLLSIFGVSLAITAFIVASHWKEIRLLDPSSISEERERQKREDLLLQRFTRLQFKQFAPFKAVGQRIVHIGKTAFHAAYIKLIQLEKFYTHAKAPFLSVAPSIKDRVKQLLDDARSLTRDMKWADAERRYLEVLTIDRRSFDAYKGLGGIYLKQKLYPQAKETFEFILRSKKADDVIYAGLAEVAEAEGDVAKTEEMRIKAIEARPRLPHRHAELAAFYLDQNQPKKAWAFAKKCCELEPKSAKYLELSLEAAILLGDRKEADRRYEALRLLSEDRQKLHVLKERIEGMQSA